MLRCQTAYDTESLRGSSGTRHRKAGAMWICASKYEGELKIARSFSSLNYCLQPPGRALWALEGCPGWGETHPEYWDIFLGGPLPEEREPFRSGHIPSLISAKRCKVSTSFAKGNLAAETEQQRCLLNPQCFFLFSLLFLTDSLVQNDLNIVTAALFVKAND